MELGENLAEREKSLGEQVISNLDPSKPTLRASMKEKRSDFLTRVLQHQHRSMIVTGYSPKLAEVQTCPHQG